MPGFKHKIIFPFCLLLLLFACNENVETEDNSATETDSVKNEERMADTKKVFYSVPSPIEMGSLLKRSGASYDLKILNPVENLSQYSSSEVKAMNLGVYGTDMSVASIFEQNQETMLYLKCVSKLSKSIGISGAFDENTAARIEENAGNKDSLLQIISEAYWEADAFLKQEKRQNVSCLIIAGGWIEGLYIATQIADVVKNNQEIITRIGEQKLSLTNLIKLIETNKTDDSPLLVLDELKSLSTVYDKVTYSKAAVEVKTDAAKKMTTLSSASKIIVSPEQLSEIKAKIGSIRNNIIK